MCPAEPDSQPNKPGPTASESPAPAASSSSASTGGPVRGSGSEVLLRGDIKIFPNSPLPHLDLGVSRAFVAESRAGAKAVAYICADHVVPRIDVAHKYANMSVNSLPKLIGSGVVYWPVDHREKYVFVYEQSFGSPLAHLRGSLSLGLKLDFVLNTIFHNTVEGLAMLHERGIAHGHVNLGNLYDGGTPTLENSCLGDCLSLPSGFAQPVLYETVERALCDPLAKPNLDYADDLYALGMCLALAIAPHDFTEGMSSEEITQYKIEQGSFHLVTSRDRLPGAIIEVLRGLLSDDVATRWTMADLKEWQGGRRVSAKQGGKSIPKSTRPIEFRKKKFFRPDILALQLRKEPAAVLELVESGNLYLWLNRSLQNKDYEARFEKAVDQAKKSVSGTNYAERMAAFVAMALAPQFPIFYRGFAFAPENFGNLLVDAMCGGKDVNALADVFQGGLVSFWAECRSITGYAVSDEVSKFESCRMLLLQKSAGFGIERCVYFLAPYARCLSDKLKHYYIRSARDLIVALDHAAGEKSRPSWFVDRHIIAFLFANDKSVIEPHSSDLNAPEKHRQISGIIKIFAKIQEREKIAALPHLATWVAEHVGELINRYHDRERRKQIKADIDRVKSKGNLIYFAGLFGNYQHTLDDQKGFVHAMAQYKSLKDEYDHLHLQLQTNKDFGKANGQQVATIVSAVIAAIVIMIYIFVNLSF